MAIFTLIGAAAGAAVGAAVVGGATAAVIGAVAGAVVGTVVGNKVKKAQKAAQTATSLAEEQITTITEKSEEIIGVTEQVTTLQNEQIAVQQEIAEDRQQQERLAVRRQRRQAIREAQIVRAR